MVEAKASPRASKLGRAIGWGMVWLVGLMGLGGAIILVSQTAAVAVAAFDATAARQRSGLLRRTTTETADYLVSPANIDSANTDVQRLVASRVVPGAVLAIGDSDRIVETAGYGRVGWKVTDDKVSPDSTIYDLASLTKAIATTSAVFLLAQDGRISLDDPVQRWLPEFQGRWKERVTWRQLLTHRPRCPGDAMARPVCVRSFDAGGQRERGFTLKLP